MTLFGHTFHPRKPLYYWERRKLEKQFGKEVPQFSAYTRKKHTLHNILFASPIVIVPIAMLTRPRTHQPISALVIGLMGFLATFTGIKTFYPPLTGMTSVDEREYDRAFNLWVYYKDRPKTSPIDTAAQRYEERLAQYRKEVAAAEETKE